MFQRSSTITQGFAGFTHNLLGSSVASAACYSCDLDYFTSSVYVREVRCC